MSEERTFASASGPHCILAGEFCDGFDFSVVQEARSQVSDAARFDGFVVKELSSGWLLRGEML